MKDNNEMNTLLTNLTNVINDLHTCLGEMRDIIAREVDGGACSAPTDGEPCHGHKPKLWDDYVLLGHPHTDWPTYERNRRLAWARERAAGPRLNMAMEPKRVK